jgi:tetratricopeptide (TPR) repeat protein
MVPAMKKAAQPVAEGNSQLESVLANMELRVLKTDYPDERARILNLAGDLCFDGGARERALSYYGRSIDVHLAAAQLDAAVSVCRKIVRLTPEVVRARCTLAWISLSRGVMEEARERVVEYAAAAAAAGQEEQAARHLRHMTDVSDHQEILESLADALMQLGDDVGADRAFGAAFGHGGPTVGYLLPDEPQRRWATVLKLIRGDDPEAAAIVEAAAAEESSESPSPAVCATWMYATPAAVGPAIATASPAVSGANIQVVVEPGHIDEPLAAVAAVLDAEVPLVTTDESPVDEAAAPKRSRLAARRWRKRRSNSAS